MEQLDTCLCLIYSLDVNNYRVTDTDRQIQTKMTHVKTSLLSEGLMCTCILYFSQNLNMTNTNNTHCSSIIIEFFQLFSIFLFQTFSKTNTRIYKHKQINTITS